MFNDKLLPEGEKLLLRPYQESTHFEGVLSLIDRDTANQALDMEHRQRLGNLADRMRAHKAHCLKPILFRPSQSL